MMGRLQKGLRHCVCGAPIKGPSRNKSGLCERCGSARTEKQDSGGEMRMVDEEKFKELMKLKQELRATDVFGEHNKFWSIVSSTDNLTFKQYKELMGLVVMGGAIAYDIYLMKQWMKRETTAAKRFVERMEKRKVKG